MPRADDRTQALNRNMDTGARVCASGGLLARHRHDLTATRTSGRAEAREEEAGLACVVYARKQIGWTVGMTRHEGGLARAHTRTHVATLQNGWQVERYMGAAPKGERVVEVLGWLRGAYTYDAVMQSAALLYWDAW